MTEIAKTFSAEVKINFQIADGIDPFTRVTGPEGDAWRAQLYPLHTEQDIYDHWAYNVICNGVASASSLDGWGDLERDDVRFWITSAEVEEW